VSAAPITYPKNKWTIAMAVTVGTLMGTIDTSIINVALPQLRGTLSATVEEITWVSTGYVVASVIIMPLTAWLGSRFGRKRVYLAGLALFILGSLFCGLSSSLWTLTLCRIVQGIGAGALQPTEQAILRETFPPEEQGKAMALYAFAIMLGPALGPTLGGWIVDNYSWRWIFYINIPIGLMGLVSVWRVVHDPPYLERTKGKVDWLGLALLVVGLGTLQTLLEQGQQNDWFDSHLMVAYAIVAGGSLAMFVAHELVTDKPIVNLRILKDLTYAMGTSIGAVLGAVLFSTLFLLPLYMQEFLGYTAMQTGLALVPRSLTMLVTIPIAGAIYNRTSPKLVVTFGMILGGITCLMMSRFTLQTGTRDILIPQMLQGVALACIFIPLSTVTLATIPRERMSDATGLNNLVRQLGGSFGVAIFASQLIHFMRQSKEALSAHIIVTDPAVQQRIAMMTKALGSPERALRVLDGQVSGQAAMLGFDKAFFAGGLLFFFGIPLVFLIKTPPRPAVKVEVPHAGEQHAVEIG
jgi:DHA2 family multidrug resistance protein